MVLLFCVGSHLPDLFVGILYVPISHELVDQSIVLVWSFFLFFLFILLLILLFWLLLLAFVLAFVLAFLLGFVLFVFLLLLLSFWAGVVFFLFLLPFFLVGVPALLLALPLLQELHALVPRQLQLLLFVVPVMPLLPMNHSQLLQTPDELFETELPSVTRNLLKHSDDILFFQHFPTAAFDRSSG